MGSDNGGGLEKALILGRKPVYPCSEYRLHRRRHINLGNFLCQFVCARSTCKRAALDERLDAFFEIKWVSLSAVNQKLLEGSEFLTFAENGGQKLLRAFG